jgi:hypothetical protein
MVGALIVGVLVVLSVAHWSAVSGFADRPTSGWALLMVACYLPATLWPPLLLAVMVAYVRRRALTRSPSTTASTPRSARETTTLPCTPPT